MQRVVARPAIKGVGRGVAGDVVVKSGAEHKFKARETVACRLTARVHIGRKVDHDARSRGRVIHSVDAGAAVQRIGPEAAGDAVIGSAAVEDVGTRVADQRVVEPGADKALDAGQHIARRIAGVGRGADVDRNRRRSRAVVGHVDASAAVQHIGPGTAKQRVVAPGPRKRVRARAAVQHVGAAVAGQAVGAGRTDDVFKLGKAVACGIAAKTGARGQIDRDAAGRGRIVGGVDAGAAGQGVSARAAGDGVGFRAAKDRVIGGTTVQRIGPGAAGQDVGVGVAGQRVIAGRAAEVFDVDQKIGRGIAVAVGIGGKVDRDAEGGGGIVGGVVARAAVKAVGPGSTHQGVIVVAAEDRVVEGAAVQRIGPHAAKDRAGKRPAGDAVGQAGADDGFDIGHHVARRRAAAARAAADGDRHARQRRGIIQRVGAGAAVDGVVAKVAGEAVVARATRQCVGVGIT